MNEDVFNMSVRKFLKKLGVTAQREIEAAVREGVTSGTLAVTSKVPARATVELSILGKSFTVEGELELE